MRQQPRRGKSRSRQNQSEDKALSSDMNWEDAAEESTLDTRAHTGRQTRRANAGSSPAVISSGGKAADRRANRQQREEETRRRTLIDLLDKARYEALVDPYRGIYSDVDSGGCGFAIPSSNGANTNGVQSVLTDEQLARRLAATEIARKRNPWGACFEVPFAHGVSLEEARVPAEDGAVDTLHLAGVGWVPCCSCPTVTSWYDEEVDKRRAKLEKETASGTKKKGRQNNKKKSNDEAGGKIGTEDKTAGDKHPADALQAIEVRRNPDEAFRCPCDYNPLCLASLGGAVDDLWRLAIKARCSEQLDKGATGLAHDVHGGLLGNIEGCVASVGPGTSVDAGTSGNTGTSDSVDGTEHPVIPRDLTESTEEAEHSVSVSEDDINSLPMQLRRSVTVDIEVIKPHLHFVVSSSRSGNSECVPARNDTAPTVNHYLNQLQQWHSTMLFQTPSEPPGGPQTTMMLSVPPGLPNLGATCYLNSQFQCLAQNPAFLRGVFSWRRDEEEEEDEGNRMAKVLAKMQHVLAQMVFGPTAVVTEVKEFAEALGILENEMQDPNEFARLLFDRLHESFQPRIDNSDNGLPGTRPDLSQLLPSLFEGSLLYETECLTCRNISSRSESFESVSLPLCTPEATGNCSPASLVTGEGKVLDPSDATVQCMLDAYLTKSECLDGENMYQCGKCKCKRDARRSISFRSLPPVLNVQVARYVFDKQTLSKGKLMDRLLLPTVLRVRRRSNNTRAGDGSEICDFVLVAVQNHCGTSAFGGHYVAETMEWSTGAWYQHNDEEVTLLQFGPNSSYDPDDLKTAEQSKKRQALRGSSDAYSLHYVEKNFLAQNALAQMRFNAHHSRMAENAVTENESIAVKTNRERMSAYQLMADVQTQQRQRRTRLLKRRSRIAEKMFAIFKRTSSESMYRNSDETQPVIWVDGQMLRRFISCTDSLDDQFNQAKPGSGGRALLCHRSLLCKHGKGLHPSVARKGKLLPSEVYNCYIDALLQEWKEYYGSSDNPIETPEPNDCIITPGQNLRCDDCARSYREQLLRKVNAVECLSELHDALDGSANDLDPSNESSAEMYVLPRTFASSLKKYAGQKMKQASLGTTVGRDTKADSHGNGVAPSQCMPVVLHEGLDVLDLKEIPHCSLDLDVDAFNVEVEYELNSSALDEQVNRKIVCPHGLSAVLNNKRVVRFVNSCTWAKLMLLFPRAITIVRKPGSEGDDKHLPSGSCRQCQIDKETSKAKKDQMLEKLRAWGERITSDGYCVSSSTGTRVYPRLRRLLEESKYSAHSLAELDPHRYFLMHHLDVETWRAAVEMATKPLPAKKAHKEKLVAELIALANSFFDKSEQADGETLQCKSRLSLRSLLCREHGLTAFPRGSISQLFTDGGMAYPLSDAQYSGFCCSLMQLDSIVSETDLEPTKWDTVPMHLSSSLPRVTSTDNLCRNGELILCQPGESRSDSDLRRVGRVLQPKLCQNDSCMAAVTQNEDPRSQGQKECDGMHGSTEETGGKDPSSGLLTVKCFEVGNSMQSLDAVRLILPIIKGAQKSSSNGTRRSTRKRKTRSTSDSVPTHDIQISPTDNIAKLRLLIFEKCHNCNPLHQKLRLFLSGSANISATSTEAPTNPEMHTIDVTWDWNCRKIKELLDLSGSGTPAGDEDRDDSEAVIHLLLCHDDISSSDGQPKKTRISKEERHERQQEVDDIVAALSETAYEFEAARVSEGQRKRTVRRRREERGFRGTFLQSMSVVSGGAEGGNLNTCHAPDDDEVIILDNKGGSDRHCKGRSDKSSLTQSAALPIEHNVPSTTGQFNDSDSDCSVSDSTCSFDSQHDAAAAKKDNKGPAPTDEKSVVILDNKGGSDRHCKGHSDKRSLTALPIEHVPSTTGQFNDSDSSVSDSTCSFDSQHDAAAAEKDKGPALTDEKFLDRSSARPPRATLFPDLSPHDLSLTKPLYKDCGRYPLKNNAGRRLDGQTEVLSLNEVKRFVQEAKKKYFAKNISPSSGDLCDLLPDYCTQDQARHLFRNFIDSPSAPSGRSPDSLSLSRRELDIAIYFCLCGGKWKECHALMPYRKEDTFSALFEEVKECAYHTNKDDGYMANAKSCVTKLLKIEYGSNFASEEHGTLSNTHTDTGRGCVPALSESRRTHPEPLNHPGAAFADSMDGEDPGMLYNPSDADEMFGVKP